MAGNEVRGLEKCNFPRLGEGGKRFERSRLQLRGVSVNKQPGEIQPTTGRSSHSVEITNATTLPSS